MKLLKLFVLVSVPAISINMISCNKAKDTLENLKSKVNKLADPNYGKKDDGLVKTVDKVNEIDGNKIIKEETRLVMVEFYSDTCGACKQIAPVLEVLAKKNAKKVRIIKVNVKENYHWVAKLKVRNVPTFLLYRGGILLKSFVGAYPKVEMQAKIDEYAKMFESKSGKGTSNSQKQPAIQKMSKDWMPPGVSKE